LDLIDIALVVLLVWVMFLLCVVALLKAADVGDEALEGERSQSLMPGHVGWRPAVLATTTRPRRGPTAGRFVGTRPLPRR
jgi:hypothetical protein